MGLGVSKSSDKSTDDDDAAIADSEILNSILN